VSSGSHSSVEESNCSGSDASISSFVMKAVSALILNSSKKYGALLALITTGG